KTKTITAVAYNGSSPVYNATFSFSNSNSSIAGLSLVRVPNGDDITTVGTPPPNLRTITGNVAGTVTLTASWNGATSSPVTVIVDDPASSPTSVIHGDNDAGGGTSITTRVGEAIEINAESSQGVSQVEWSWGDGDKTTDLLSATHAYLLAGTYSLTLKITNSAGQISTSTVSVNVQEQTACTAGNTQTATSVSDLRTKYESLPLSGGRCILLAPGVYVGDLELIARNFTDYVTIGSNASMPNILNRITPGDSGLVTIRSSSNQTSVTPMIIKNGATKLRFIGIKFDPAYASPNTSDVNSNYYVVQVGEAFTQNNVSENPTKIIFQHCVINPNDDVKVPHGILMDGYKISVISSWFGNIKTFGGQDSQAAVSFDGKGAHVYNNTFLEASSENILYGGVVPHINGLTSANIEIRRCYFSKRLSWRVYKRLGTNNICSSSNTTGEVCGHEVNAKNLLETKNARRMYVEGTVFENHWDGYRQQLFAFVFKTATSPGSVGEFVPWAISEDIVFENSKAAHLYGGITHSVDNYDLAPFMGLKPSNVKMKNVLFDDLSERWGIPGNGNGARFLQPNTVEDLQLEHTTMIDKDHTAGTAILFVTNNNFRFSITNSVFGLGGYGIIGGASGVGIRSLNPGSGGSNNNCVRASDATWIFKRNVMPFYGEDSSCFPEPTATPPPIPSSQTANWYPLNYSSVGFVDLTNGDYRLSSSSPYKNAATDGTDPGADIPLLNSRTSCAVSGIGTNCTTTPPSGQSPYPGPTPSVPATIEVENFDKGGQNVAYNDIFGSTSSGAYRTNPVETVDVFGYSNASNGFAVFEAAAGEWLEYTINVPAPGLYNFKVRYASGYTQPNSQGQFRLEVCQPAANDGVTNCISSGSLNVSSSGGWNTFQTVSRTLNLPSSGTRILRLIMVTNAPGDGTPCNCVVANFDSITIADRPTLFDYDNDAKADISVYRPSDHTWYLNRSTAGFAAYAFGLATDVIAPGDFDGDSKTDVAVWRPTNGTWYILRSSDAGVTIIPFGSNGDVPVQADYDGDGKADIAVWRPTDGTWYILRSSDAGVTYIQYGSNGDKPAVGDYNGDGISDAAVFRPSDGKWYINNYTILPFGNSTDKITPADYDGDGKTDIAVFRPSEGNWYWINSGTGTYAGLHFGSNGDIPVPADFDGDSKADIAVYRPSDGTWYQMLTTTGYTGYQFGLNGDVPTPSTYVR
ncbi:MAG: FG-GAP-like repeat-containing protein, partial [Pyrinomonadaceae bacterium]